MKIVFLDTCACIYLYEKLDTKFSKKTKKIIEDNPLGYSPTVGLELKYLEECNKITSHKKVISFLNKIVLAQEVESSYIRLTKQAIEEIWTRDPFDRLIVSQARLEESYLISSDKKISKNYDMTII